MAWSDYFIPDFDNPDSLSYVETSPYLPIGSISVLDCQQEVDNALWDFRNEIATVRAISNNSFPTRLRNYAKSIDAEDWDYIVEEEKPIPQSDYVFTFGKYKGYKLTTVLDRDPSYVEWCRKNISWFNK